MELIFYNEAARMLDISVDTLKSALTRPDVLTKAGRKGKNVLLIKEQVLLYTGKTASGRKKWLSQKDLTPDERREWQRYAKMANAEQSQAGDMAVIDQDALMQVVKQALLEERAREAEQQAEEARQRAIKAREQSEKERFHEGHPFLVRVKRELQTA